MEVVWAVHVDRIGPTAVLSGISRTRSLAQALVKSVFEVRALPATTEAPSSKQRIGHGRGLNLLYPYFTVYCVDRRHPNKTKGLTYTPPPPHPPGPENKNSNFPFFLKSRFLRFDNLRG